MVAEQQMVNHPRGNGCPACDGRMLFLCRRFAAPLGLQEPCLLYPTSAVSGLIG